ncbi:MAG: type II CAAX endopeptidase family protein [Balneolales bacterium]
MHIFDNPHENRIRAGWRLLLQFIIFLFLLMFSRLLLGDVLGENLMLVWYSVIATLSVWFAAKTLDQRRLREYGLEADREWVKHFLTGAVLGGVTMAVLFLVYLALGWVELIGFGWDRSRNGSFSLAFAGYFLAMCSVGYYEELWSRGYQTKNLAEGLNFARFKTKYAVLAAILLTSVFFGLLHAFNPFASVLSTIIITLAGVMFAIPYVVTGRLGLSIGLHISWNFFQGGIFGFPVSGVSNRISIIQIRTSGPELWTGGLFGPEAGLSGLLAVMALTGVIILYLKKTGYNLTPAAGFAGWVDKDVSK